MSCNHYKVILEGEETCLVCWRQEALGTTELTIQFHGGGALNNREAFHERTINDRRAEEFAYAAKLGKNLIPSDDNGPRWV